MNSLILAAALSCPGYVGHITFNDYAGPVTFDMCVATLQLAPPNMYVTIYDPTTDGIFHNGFD